MINLITGGPGTGKTAYSLLFMQKMISEGRPLFVHGVPDLKLKHEVVKCNSPSCEPCGKLEDFSHTSFDYLKAEEWHEWAPDGAVIFYDEVQNIYRPRASTKEVPPSVAAFEVHRHRGLDFFLITQSPHLIEINVRKLVGRHIHLRSTWAGRYQFEWPECHDNVQAVTQAVKSKYKLPKKVFSLYKSASLHTKQERKVPFVAFFLVFVVLMLAGLSYRIYARTNELMTPDDKKYSQKGATGKRRAFSGVTGMIVS